MRVRDYPFSVQPGKVLNCNKLNSPSTFQNKIANMFIFFFATTRPNSFVLGYFTHTVKTLRIWLVNKEMMMIFSVECDDCNINGRNIQYIEVSKSSIS